MYMISYNKAKDHHSWGMLYLYYLVLLKEMSSLSDFCKKIANKDRFKIWLLAFSDQVIRYEWTSVDINKVLSKVKSLALAAKDASIFASQLKDDANLIISRVQMYSWTHNATCFKYGHNKTQCWFNFLQLIIPNSNIDNTRYVFLQKNNVWINLWNPVLAFILKSNQNITFVASSSNALALIYYITNYVIKSNCSQYQWIMHTVFVKKAHDNIKLSANVITNVLPDKFAFRAFNRFTYNREISGCLVTSYLLELPDYYTLSDNVKSINLAIIPKRYSKFALHIYKIRLTINDLLCLWYQMSPFVIFDHYYYYRSSL